MYNKDNTNTSLDEILRQSKLNKIITNPEKLPNNLQNYVSVSKTWNIEKKEFIHYYYMNNVNDKELQLTPLKTLKQIRMPDNRSSNRTAYPDSRRSWGIFLGGMGKDRKSFAPSS